MYGVVLWGVVIVEEGVLCTALGVFFGVRLGWDDRGDFEL